MRRQSPTALIACCLTALLLVFLPLEASALSSIADDEMGIETTQETKKMPTEQPDVGTEAERTRATEVTVEKTFDDEVSTREVPKDKDESTTVEEGTLSESISIDDDSTVTPKKDTNLKDTELQDGELVAQADSTALPKIEYCGHVQNIGWQKYVKDGAVAGTSGQSLRVEALRIRATDVPAGIAGSVRYRMHVERVGWQDWVKDDALGGTAGRGLRVEAIQVKLDGDLASAYDVWYRVHAQNVGWMGWAKNGETSGTAGHALRLEGIQIKLTRKNDGAPSNEGSDTSSRFLGGSGVAVSAHVQNVGWMSAVGSGEIAGTTGRGLRMEAVSVGLNGVEVPGDVQVQAHVQNIGWTGWVNGGQAAGSVGQSLRVEAFKIKLTGEAADRYDIWYRAHVANIGWMGWATNGDESGTSSMSTRVEALQVVLVGKGAQGPRDDGNVSEAYLTGGTVNYSSNVIGKGWLGTVGAGTVSGTTGENRAMVGFKATYSGDTLDGGISYRAHVANVGWQGWASNGGEAGAGNNAIEALCISLNGRASQVYDVWYRVHISDAGWLGWARNGEVAGSTGLSKSVQAVQIMISSKETPAPGSTKNHQVDRSYFYDPMTQRAQGYGSDTSWLILVDTSLNRCGIYHGSRGNWQRTDLVTVSCGAYGSSTVKGVFKATDRGYSFGSYYTCYYWTRFYGDYLFHSVLYHPGTFNIMDGTLGQNVSHGCVRMPIEKAKWIHDCIPYGTTVVTY